MSSFPSVAATPAKVEWSAPATCPHRDAFVERVKHWISDRTRLESSILHVQIDRRVEEFAGAVEVASAGASPVRRELVDADCAALIDALALLAAMELDPSAKVPADPPRPSPPRVPEATVPAEPSPSVSPTVSDIGPRVARSAATSQRASRSNEASPSKPEATTPSPAPAGTRRGRWLFPTSIGASWALFEATHGHLSTGIDGQWRMFGVRARIAADLPGVATGTVGNDRVSIIGAAVHAQAGICFVPGRNRIAVPICGLGGVGPIFARAYGAPTSYTRASWVWTLGAEAGVRVRISPRVHLGVRGELLGTTQRARFYVNAIADELTTPAMGGRVSIVLAVSRRPERD